MAERPSEIRCKESLTRWLRLRYPDETPDWEYEPEGRNRIPDYRLTFVGRDYAAEAHMITLSSEVTAFHAFREMGQEIELEARRTGGLIGQFMLSYYPPVTLSRARRKSIREKALHYMAAHATDAEAMPVELLPHRRRPVFRRVVIKKVGIEKDALLCIQGGRAIRHAELETKATECLRDAITRKLRLFEKAQEARPRVLTLDDGLYLPSAVTYGSCLQRLPGEGLLDSFAAVFLAHSSGEGEMLHESSSCFPPRARR